MFIALQPPPQQTHNLCEHADFSVPPKPCKEVVNLPPQVNKIAHLDALVISVDTLIRCCLVRLASLSRASPKYEHAVLWRY